MVGKKPPHPRLFRFGPFELNVRSGELRKHGIKIKLSEQPERILVMLLDHAGDVVLREEIRLELWPNNTVVEFDHSINAAIQKLRDALGESADKPRYVATLPRRGYRFLGEVERVGEPQPEPLPAPVPQSADDLSGKLLSHFRILNKLGEGGMGVVYRAEDLKLGRHVALKVLSAEDGELPEALIRRFEREARAASALNHPHICTIHGLEDLGGQPAIVMELVEGESLAARLAKGPVPLDQARWLAMQIADALSEAHYRGVVHRDLQPANIMLTRSGAKVLDFGLARMARPVAASSEAATLTQRGAFVGTLHYMSPEQLQGKEVDARSDIFSFGLVLYEMLSGRRAFEGESAAGVMAGILEREPPPLEPGGLNRVVKTCLAKDPNDRFGAASDLKRAIEGSISGGDEPVQPQAEVRRRRHTLTIVSALGMLLAAGAAYWWLRPGTRPADLIAVPLVGWPAGAYMPAFSPDGNRVAFNWVGEKGDKPHLYIGQIGSGAQPVQITNSPAGDFYAAWSPDDKYIAFFASVGGGRALMLVPSIGGPPRKVADFSADSGPLAWSPDSKWLFTVLRDSPRASYSVWLISAASGERRRLTTPAAGLSGDLYPSISPDGRSLAFMREMASYGWALLVLPLSRDYRPEGQPREPTTRRYTNVGGTAWTADGREIVFSAGPFYNKSLFRVPASGRHSAVRLPYALPDSWEPIISPTRSRLAYWRRTLNMNLWRLDTRTGDRKMLVSSNGISQIPQYSPDGRKIAFQSNRSGEEGVWTCDGDGSNCMQLAAFGSAMGGSPRWSPDSQWIAFDSRVDGRSHILAMRADGGGRRSLTNGPADDSTPSWAHDGRWIYFASDRSGRMETWKIPAQGGTAVQVSRAGGGPAFESADGEYLYYVKYSGSGSGPLFRMPVEGGAEIQALPQVTSWASFAIFEKAIYFSPDGKAMQRLELPSGKISTLATLEKGFSFCVSPDERFVLRPQVDRNIVELMLVEGFR